MTSRWGAIRGASITTLHDTLTGSHPAPPTASAARRSSSRLSAPAQAGSVSLKSCPMSAESRSRQERLDAGVGDDVGVGMSVKTALAFEPHAAQNQPTGRDRRCNGGRRSPAPPASRDQPRSPPGVSEFFACPQQHLGHGKVVRLGDFEVAAVSRHYRYRPAGRLHQGGIVGGVGAADMRGPQDVGPEGLRRLHSHQLCAVGGSAVAAPDRVGQVDHRDGCVGAVAHCLNHPHEHRVAGQRPSTVVHEHDLGVAGHKAEPAAHRVRAQHPARGHENAATAAARRDRGRRPGVGPGLGQHDHHALAPAGGPAYGPVDHAAVPERLELLGAPEAVALPGRHHDRPHRRAASVVLLAISRAHRH